MSGVPGGAVSLRGPAFAVGAAVAFALSVPLGKLLLGEIGSFTLAGILYLGAGLGLTVYRRVAGQSRRSVSEDDPDSPALSPRKSRLCLAGAIVSGGIIAPALLFWGLASLSAAPASLMLSLEVVFTALLAGLFFREQIARQVWASVALVFAASVLLAWTGGDSRWSLTALAVGLATFFWGLDNNLTREVRGFSAAYVAQIKGLVAGPVNLIIGIFIARQVPDVLPAVGAAVLGAVSYGLSLVLFVRALRLLGSARTGAYFSSAPVLAGLLSIVIFVQPPGWQLLVAFALVVLATLLMVSEKHAHDHSHGGLVHSHSHWPDEEHRHTH